MSVLHKGLFADRFSRKQLLFKNNWESAFNDNMWTGPFISLKYGISIFFNCSDLTVIIRCPSELAGRNFELYHHCIPFYQNQDLYKKARVWISFRFFIKWGLTELVLSLPLHLIPKTAKIWKKGECSFLQSVMFYYPKNAKY